MDKGNIRIQGTIQEIQKRDPQLYAEWKEMITKKEAELQKHMETKTAKDRWSLLKLVSKIGLQFKNHSWANDENVCLTFQIYSPPTYITNCNFSQSLTLFLFTSH